MNAQRSAARWASTTLLFVLSLMALAASPALGRDPWTPRGSDFSDQERYDPKPRGFVDKVGPVEVAPKGKLVRATTDRTNIVVIMVDDHPEMDGRVWDRLPAIKRTFVRQGLRFTRYYGNDPLCCPGRSNFLTGQTTDHHGVWTNDARLLDPATTVATELQAAGYYTFVAGKYLNFHLGGIDLTPPGWSQTALSSNGYYNFLEYVNGEKVYHDEDPDDYQPDVAFNRALQYLRDAPADQPLFAWITPFTTHGGRDPQRPDQPRNYPPSAPRFGSDPRCTGLDPWVTPAHADDTSDRPLYQQRWNIYREGYDLVAVCRSLLAVDAGVQRVVDELKAQGRLRNTLFVLTSDNGMGWGAHGFYSKPAPFVTQMPLYVRWAAGRGLSSGENKTFLSNLDLAPTLCEVGGCVMGPYPNGQAESDGTSFLGVILGTGEVKRQAIYTEHLGNPLWRQLITTPGSPLGLWHYVQYGTGERELYDASGGQCWTWRPGERGDPCELTNLAGLPQYADVEAGLAGLMETAVQSEGAGARFKGRAE